MSGRTFCCDGTGKSTVATGEARPACFTAKVRARVRLAQGELVAVRRVKVCSKVTCVVPELSRGVSTMRTVTLSPSKVRCEKPQVRPRDQSVGSCGFALSC